VPIEDFFHEVAFNQMNAGRGQFVPQPPWWRRFSRWLGPAARRTIAVVVALAMMAAAWVYRHSLTTYLRTHPPHRPGAADTLTFAHRRSPPDQVVRRLAIACAREDDPAGCEAALATLLKLTDAATVAETLAFPEIKALRTNEFFHRFACGVEAAKGRAGPSPSITPRPGTLP